MKITVKITITVIFTQTVTANGAVVGLFVYLNNKRMSHQILIITTMIYILVNTNENARHVLLYDYQNCPKINVLE